MMPDVVKIGDYVVRNIRPDYADEEAKKKAEQEVIKTIGLCCRRIRQDAEAGKDEH